MEAMSDDALIRLQNLRALRLTPTQLSERIGGRYTYWRDMLGGNKSFGERIARKIEQALGMPRGAMDIPGVNPGDLPTAPVQQAFAATDAVPSHEAVELGALFDMLPADRITRTVAYNAATEAILRVLREHAHGAQPSAAPTPAANPKKQPA